MSLFQTMQSAAKLAQSTLAQMQGMEAGACGNVLINGALCIGVYGAPQVTDAPSVGGGYKRTVQLNVTITRDQFTAAPVPKVKLTRTDIAPPITYTVNVVDVNDPLVFTLVLEKVGI